MAKLSAFITGNFPISRYGLERCDMGSRFCVNQSAGFPILVNNYDLFLSLGSISTTISLFSRNAGMERYNAAGISDGLQRVHFMLQIPILHRVRCFPEFFANLAPRPLLFSVVQGDDRAHCSMMNCGR